MQAGGRLVQHIDGAAVGALLQFGCELHALRFTAGEGGCGLAQANVAQAHVHEGVQVARNRGERGEELCGFFHGHFEHVGDGLALVVHLEGFAVVALAVAGFTGHVHVRQEVHFNLQGAVAGAVLTAATLDVEGEAAGGVAAHLRFAGLCEQLADVVEHAGVGGGVRARGAADGRLVHVNDLVQVFQAVDALVAAGHLLGAVELVRQGGVQNVVDEGGFARAGHTGHRGEHAQREGHSHVLEVVFAGTAHGQLAFLVHGAAGGGHLNAAAASHVVAGDGPGVLQQLLEAAGVHDFTAVLARAGPDVHDPVGFAHGVFVVLNHDKRVAHIAQLGQGFDEAAVIALVQADGGFVQHVEHADQARTNLGGQADALGLTAGERACGAREGQVVQAHIQQELQARVDFLEHLLTNLGFAGAELQAAHEGKRIGQGQVGDLGDGLAADLHTEDGRVQARATAGGAGDLAHVLFVAVAGEVRFGFFVLALDVRLHAFESGGVAAFAAESVAVGHLNLVVLAVQDGGAGLGGQVLEGGVQVEAELLPQACEQA